MIPESLGFFGSLWEVIKVFLFIGCVVVSVAAIFLGPVFGVGVLLEWLEERDRNRRKKREEKLWSDGFDAGVASTKETW
ncbi:hypothetical protein [Ralstonia insidiosa]|jgi:hypothetical protein|uniref:hypothetical protein n=1 Tax=Ralstonia insidiosa TaxID=190721 RepID=UPI000CEDD8CF|nr:hypothetical protein [Ralstonia insidiosa]